MILLHAALVVCIALTLDSYTLQAEARPIRDHYSNCRIQRGDRHLQKCQI